MSVEFLARLFVGNLGYILLVASMMMTRIFLLRMLAISSGVVGVAYSSVWLSDPVGTFWEGAFVAAGAVQLFLSARNRRHRLSGEESAFQAAFIQGADRGILNALLRAGFWKSAEPGTVLMDQGSPASHLLFLMSGNVAVMVDGKRTATWEAGALIGDCSGRATATVVADQHVRYFAIASDRLERLMSSEREIAETIYRCKLQSLEKKLIGMNEAMLRTSAKSKSDRALKLSAKSSRRVHAVPYPQYVSFRSSASIGQQPIPTVH